MNARAEIARRRSASHLKMDLTAMDVLVLYPSFCAE